MRIGVDARELAGRATGVGRYLRGLLRHWSAAGDDTLLLYFNGPPPEEAVLRLPHVQVHASARPARGLLWQERGLPRLAQDDALDVFFAPAYACPLRLRVPRVTVVHDVSFYRLPQDFTFLEALRRRATVGPSLSASARVVAVSDFSLREILTLRPELAGRVVAIEHGADDDLPTAPPRAEARARLGLDGPYLLTVGSIFNRRRLPELLRAVALLRARHARVRLDVVGENRTQPCLDLERLARELGLGRHVRFAGFVDEADLAARYAAADVALFLSDYEGFGLPAMEAAARGVPLVVSARPALSEIFGSAALLVDAEDASAVADAVARVLGSTTLRDELRARGRALGASHTWADCARRTRDVLADAARTPRRHGGQGELKSRDALPAATEGDIAGGALPRSDTVLAPSRAGAPVARVAVVLVSYNTRDDLVAALGGLYAHVRLPLEVFVVDNASQDGSAEAVRAAFPQVELIANARNVGFGAANNQALRLARAPYVLLLNPDALVRPGLVEALLARLDSDARLGAIAPLTRHADGTPQVSFGPDLGLVAEWRQRRLVAGVQRREPRALARAEALTQREHSPDWLSAACLLLRADALRAVGGFDEDYFLYEEDADLCLRLRRAGFGLLHVPAVEVVHASGRSTGQAPARTRLAYQRSHLLYYRKHRGALEVLGLRLLLAVEALAGLSAGHGPGADPAERHAYARALLSLALGASAPAAS